jgi:hypothetical protein
LKNAPEKVITKLDGNMRLSTLTHIRQIGLRTTFVSAFFKTFPTDLKSA